MDSNIGTDTWKKCSGKKLTDNLRNTYSRAVYGTSAINSQYEKLLNMKYSKFKGTLYVIQGTDSSYSGRVTIKADGKTIYSSPEITKSTAPIPISVDITGCYHFQINSDAYWIAIGDGGFYQ